MSGTSNQETFAAEGMGGRLVFDVLRHVSLWGSHMAVQRVSLSAGWKLEHQECVLYGVYAQLL